MPDGAVRTNPPVQHDEAFLFLLREAILRLKGALKACQFIESTTWPWIEKLGGGAGPESYFLHPSATPVFLVPWRLELALNGRVDPEFHAAVMYSTVNLCYFVRILDDALDGHKDTAHLLPALSFFHSRYQGAYTPLFGSGHPFWRYFFGLNDQFCETTAYDFALKNITLSQFQDVTAKKSCAGLVSVAAVAAHYNRYDVFEAWADFWHAFGQWNQMRDDFFDWQKDLKSNIDTYFLSEARRRKRSGEEIAGWLIREGLDWVRDTLNNFGREAKDAAARVGSGPLESYVQSRVAEVEDKLGRLTRALAAIDAAAK